MNLSLCMLNTQKTDLQAACLLSLNGSSVQHQYTYIPFMSYKYLFFFSPIFTVSLVTLYKKFLFLHEQKKLQEGI